MFVLFLNIMFVILFVCNNKNMIGFGAQAPVISSNNMNDNNNNIQSNMDASALPPCRNHAESYDVCNNICLFRLFCVFVVAMCLQWVYEGTMCSTNVV